MHQHPMPRQTPIAIYIFLGFSYEPVGAADGVTYGCGVGETERGALIVNVGTAKVDDSRSPSRRGAFTNIDTTKVLLAVGEDRELLTLSCAAEALVNPAASILNVALQVTVSELV